ncbi:GDSL esterase/lipase 1-like [Abrus precatorius]|uniref:GDSL esterase/lipase 1-like n=1 Tax=Abrus precatorius TaxID=3816 RepID=A0A8B8K0P3_ABRPR|nr:GDSL esterase/lipase 1-like [Abrus precatorius]
MGRVTSIVGSCCLALLLAINILSRKCDAEDEFKVEKEQKGLFVLGDSLFDPGNTQYIKSSLTKIFSAGNPPYGESFFKHPTGRFSDGRVVPDFIATFAGLPLISPYLQPHPTPFTDGANFAMAGAAVTDGLDPNVNLPKQLSYFKALAKSLEHDLGEIEAKRVLEKSVYLFSIGGNDYVGFQNQNPNATKSSGREFIDQVVYNLTDAFKAIYSLGGRKIAYQNVGPLGCAPSIRARSGGDCNEELLEMAREHNQAFSEVLKKLEIELSGFKYSFFDYYVSFYDIVINPVKCGFKEVKRACCGVGPFRGSGCGTKKYELCDKPSEYVWFDGEHPVERVNLQMANLLWSGPPEVTGPYNMKQLFQI